MATKRKKAQHEELAPVSEICYYLQGIYADAMSQIADEKISMKDVELISLPLLAHWKAHAERCSRCKKFATDEKSGFRDRVKPHIET